MSRSAFVAPLAALLAIPTLSAPACAQQAAPPAGLPADAPWHFTNTENVRRVAASAGYVALATSGGVRVWKRDDALDAWRVVTQDDGLPTHNVYDVAFDPKDADTLWALCGSWQEKPRRLYLASIDLKTGTAKTVGEDPSAPAAAEFTGMRHFADYRLAALGDGAFVVAIGRGTGRDTLLSFKDGRWGPLPDTGGVGDGPTLPRAGAGAGWIGKVYPGAIFPTKSAILLAGRGGFLVHDRNAKTTAAYPFPEAKQGGGFDFDGTATALARGFRMSGVPFDVKAEAAGTFTFSLVEQTREWRPKPPADGGPVTQQVLVSDPAVSLLRVRFPTGLSNNGGYQLLSRTRLTGEEAQKTVKLSQDAARASYGAAPLLQGGQLTDVLDDGRYLWLATYNHPGRHATGLTRYDLTTKEVIHPAAPSGGLAANMLFDVMRLSDRVIVQTMNGQSTFDPAKGRFLGWRESEAAMIARYEASRTATPAAPARAGGRVRRYETVMDPEGKGRRLEALAAAEPGEDVWVRWTEGIPEDDPAVRMQRFRDGTYRFPLRIWRIGCVVEGGRRLETFEGRNTEIASVCPESVVIQKATGRLFVLGADRGEVAEKAAQREAEAKRQEEARAAQLAQSGAPAAVVARRRFVNQPPVSVAPVLLIWDAKSGEVTRQPARRGQGTRLPVWYREVSVTLFDSGLIAPGSLFEAAGEVWLHTMRFPEGNALFRFDPRTGDWVREGAYARVYPYPDVLFAVYGEWPKDLDVLRREPGRARKLEGELRRWTPAANWERWDGGGLAGPAYLPLIQNAFLREDIGSGRERLWIGGIGLVSVPEAAMRFVPLGDSGTGAAAR